jgi:reverse gyrase 2
MGMDREIRKIAEAIAEKINDISMDETEIIDNGKEIRKLRNIISEKKKILDKIENGEIRKLNMTSINYETERVQGGNRKYRSSIEKLEDLKEKLIHEINTLECELAKLEYEEFCFIETFWDY